jgi:AraC family transcriptional regulator
MGKEGWLGGGCRFIGISHDDPEITPSGRIRYDACVTVDDSFVPEGEIGVQIIAGGDFARATHAGPYENLKQTYGRLMGQWLPRSGRRLGDAPCLEFYLNDPGGTPPAELLTDVYAPLEARS